MPTLNCIIEGDTASSVVLNALSDGKGGPSGVSLPANFTFENGVWSFPFSGSSPLYAYSYVVTLSLGAVQTVSSSIAGDGQPAAQPQYPVNQPPTYNVVN